MRIPSIPMITPIGALHLSPLQDHHQRKDQPNAS